MMLHEFQNCGYWGSQTFVWFFWLVLVIVFFLMLSPLVRKKLARSKNKPHEILLERLARGEINEDDYEKRKMIIERDSK